MHLLLCSVWYARIPLSTTRTRTSLPGVDSVGSRHERCGVAYARSVQVAVMPEVFARDMSWSCFYRLCYLLTDNCHSSCCPRSCAHRICVYLSLARSLSFSLSPSLSSAFLSLPLSRLPPTLFSLSLSLVCSLSSALSECHPLFSLSLSLPLSRLPTSTYRALYLVCHRICVYLSLSLVFRPPSILFLSLASLPLPLSRLLSTSATLYSLSLSLVCSLRVPPSILSLVCHPIFSLSSRSNTGYERVRFQCSASGSSRRVSWTSRRRQTRDEYLKQVRQIPAIRS